jgi:hypothetical protein
VSPGAIGLEFPVLTTQNSDPSDKSSAVVCEIEQKNSIITVPV